jgi:hypothetical protein
VEESIEAIAVGRHYGLERIGGTGGKIDAEHAADRLRGKLDARVFGGLRESVA